ncbi:hypothetical protein CRUP_032545, partial [Coryphaenoides rupestris]
KKLSKRRLSPVGSLQSSEDTSKTSQPSDAPDPSGTSDPQPPPIGGSPSPGPSAAPDPTEHQNLALLQPKPEPEEHEIIAVQVKVEIEMETPIWPPEDVVVIKQENLGEEDQSQGRRRAEKQPTGRRGLRMPRPVVSDREPVKGPDAQLQGSTTKAGGTER